MIIKYLKFFGINLLTIFIFTFILSIINYFDLISNNIIDIFKLIILLFSLFINSFFIGKNSKSKGYLEGLKFGIIFIIFILLFNLILIRNFSIKTIIYYILILVTSMVGSTIGINRKKG